MAIEDVKLLYASAPRGVRLTIPLVREGAYDTADILARLKKAGVTDDELPYVIFSPKELPADDHPGPQADNVQLPGEKIGSDEPPDIPSPSGPGKPPALNSSLGPLTSVAVSPEWRQLTGRSYCMRRADGAGFVSMLDLQPQAFENADDYHIIQDGRLKLCYGLRWHQITVQFLSAGASWNQQVTTKHGMSTTTSYSISASVGYSGGGASASLSATFGQTFVVTDEKDVVTTVDVQPVIGKTQTASLWNLQRYYVVEVDGVVRDTSNPFRVVFLDKGGRHQLNDAWAGLFDIISTDATLKTWAWDTK